jgi:hypothetical protein
MAIFSNKYYYLNNLNLLNILTYSHYLFIFINTKNKNCFVVEKNNSGGCQNVENVKIVKIIKKLKSQKIFGSWIVCVSV